MDCGMPTTETLCGTHRGVQDNLKQSSSPTNAIYPGPAAPPFVGVKYFCESGIVEEYQNRLWCIYVTNEELLQDSQGRASGSTCRNYSGPWLTIMLNQRVSDDSEVGMLFGEISSNEDISVDNKIIYVYIMLKSSSINASRHKLFSLDVLTTYRCLHQ